MNRDGTIDFSGGGTDRITQTTNDVTTDHGTTVRRSRTYVWLDGDSTGTLVSQTEISARRPHTWQTQYRDTGTPVTTHQHTSYGGTSRTVINIAPDGSYTSQPLFLWPAGSPPRVMIRPVRKSAALSYGYDAHGRQYQVTDARNGTTTLGFNNADLVATNTTPNPGNGGSQETTTTALQQHAAAGECDAAG